MLNNLMITLMSFVKDVKEREEGQGLVEYALILVFVSIVAIVALQLLGTSISDVFDKVTGSLS